MMSFFVRVGAPRHLDVRRFFVLLGLLIVGIVVVAAIFAPLIATHDPYVQNLDLRMVPPSWMDGGGSEHLFGTDQLGRDYFSRLVYGARISMTIGLLTVIISGLIGISLGVIGGFFGGRVDNVVMFIITCRLSIPLILVALTVVALIGNSLAVVIVTLGFLLWERFAVVARTTTMQVRHREFVDAARAAGASLSHILIREILPSIMPHLIVVATLEMAIAIMLEAALSFLGLGVPPPLPSWGLMIAEARDYMFFTPWVIMIPGLSLFILVFGINLVGDGMRDLIMGSRSR
ncbi:ABC transporter permease [Mesorhizobium sp. YR577]|uniref:ABC transporter permease n=1 Tax=Mesorhizobium sp. YR577 TaxID=1884373 RepID=UPI0008E8A2EA|nr:peptide/nickel transport system permease protein [Mesorhizobium sp. YR577]